MIQELLGDSSCFNFGGGGAAGRNFSINGTILDGTTKSTLTSSPSSATSPSSTTTTNNSAASAAKSEQSQHLRCPRCDSSNTKFCYYNNYNLTQPRHFCKTCRRYWTKGGALRHVPIGGGCRKNKSATSVSTTMGKSSAAAKMKTVVSDIVRSGHRNGFDQEIQSSRTIWASPQSSHLLALLRTTQNPNSSSTNIKEEISSLGGVRSHVMNEPAALSVRTLGSDPLSQVPSLGLCSPLWKNNQDQHQAQQQQQNNNNNNGSFLQGEVQNTGIQELYQRLKSSSNYYSDSSAVVLSNVGSSSSSLSGLESAPTAGGEWGYWNPVYSSSWSDLPTTNGAYP